MLDTSSSSSGESIASSVTSGSSLATSPVDTRLQQQVVVMETESRSSSSSRGGITRSISAAAADVAVAYTRDVIASQTCRGKTLNG